MDQDDGGTEGDPLAATLFESISPQVDVRDGLRKRAASRLIQQRDPIREPKDFRRLVQRQVATEDDPDFGLERVSGVDSGISSQRRGVELGPEVTEDILETALDQSLSDRTEAVRRRGHQLRGL